MPKYLYTAKNSASGESSSGEMIAADEKALAQDLRSQGLLLTSFRAIEGENKVSVRFLDRFQSVPLKEKMLFTRNLSVMIASGLTISRALHNLALQTKNKTFKKLLDQVFSDLQAGKTLSEAMGKYPRVFNELFVNMIAVGEVSGNLEQVLDILALQLEKEHDLLSKVRGALIYPCVILVVMIGIGCLMLFYILPKISAVFADLGVELPVTTRFIIALSDFVRGNAILTLAGFIGVILGVRFFFGTGTGKRFFGWVFVRMPVIGNIVIKVNCARFARIYSSLLKSGVAVVTALTIVSKTLTNVHYKEALKVAIEEVERGIDLSKVLVRYPHLFPLLVSQIVEVGEETGKTDMVLERLAEFYEEEVSQITKNMSSIIEPILMLIIGVGVGFFAVAMLQPMYSVLQNIQ